MTAQTTFLHSARCTGVGLHSGQAATLTFKPAHAGSGIVFRRTDMPRGKQLIPARYDLVCETRLGTVLRNRHGVTLSTVEHVMAALWGAGIDNALIEVDGPEVPIMDGSSEQFMALIAQAGIARLEAPRKVLRVLREVEVSLGESSAAVAPLEPEADIQECTLDISIDFAHPAITHNRALYDFNTASFDDALARARTFGFARDVEALRAQGLARGGSLDNAIVLGDTEVLNAEGLRFADEFIRHKALDCVGDVYLAGVRIEGAFSFVRPGHSINNQLVRALMADASAWTLVSSAMPQRSALRIAEAAYL